MDQTHNVQFSIEAEETFYPVQFEPDVTVLPFVFGSGCTYQSFTPRRAEVTEIVSATYARNDGSEITLHETLPDGADAFLTQAFSGNLNCFPHAPDIAKAVPGPALGRIEDLGWPAVVVGGKFEVAFAIAKSIMSRARGTCQNCGEPSGRLPAGYNPIPKSIKVQVRLTLSGPVVNK